MITIREERMSDIFMKHHVDGLRVPAVFHQIDAPDEGDPHDHPWGFTSFIISGGYEEQVFHPAIGWTGIMERRPGDAFRIVATHIHRIVRLLDGPCETIILPGPPERTSHFWQFREDGSYSRAWHESEWTKYQP